MSLTPEERAAISRENGRKSCGPKTDEGKCRSRNNALKHGLRAELLAMPNEDPAEVAARAHAWNEFYRPESPAAHHLVNQCARATLRADRCHQAHDAAIFDQVRAAGDHFDRAQLDEVDRNKKLLRAEPADAVRRLEQTAAGCRYLIHCWVRLCRILREHGWLYRPEYEEALHLLGDPADNIDERLFDESPARLERDPTSIAQENRRAWFEPIRPIFLRQGETILARLRSREEELRGRIEEPSRAEAADRALVLQDDRQARLFLRYEAEARTTFSRSYKDLMRLLERGEATGNGQALDSIAEPATSPNEPEPLPTIESIPSPFEPEAGAPPEPEKTPNEPTETPIETSPNEPGRAVEPAPEARATTESRDETPHSPVPAPAVVGPRGKRVDALSRWLDPAAQSAVRCPVDEPLVISREQDDVYSRIPHPRTLAGSR